MKTRCIKLSEICTTAGTQIRARIDADAVADYADAMVDGAKFPPVVVFHDGSEYILADGFHRVMACSRNGFKDIEADVHKGTKADALKYALGANSSHGIKRTNADKKRSVELALAEWPKLADVELSRICAVGDDMVKSVRSEMECNLRIPKVETRIGADGKERKMPTRKVPASIASEPTSPPCPDEEESPHIRTYDEEFKADCGNPDIPAMKIEPAVVEYYSRLQELVEEALREATDKQLASMSVYAALVPKLIKDEQHRRKNKL